MIKNQGTAKQKGISWSTVCKCLVGGNLLTSVSYHFRTRCLRTVSGCTGYWRSQLLYPKNSAPVILESPLLWYVRFSSGKYMNCGFPQQDKARTSKVVCLYYDLTLHGEIAGTFTPFPPVEMLNGTSRVASEMRRLVSNCMLPLPCVILQFQLLSYPTDWLGQPTVRICWTLSGVLVAFVATTVQMLHLLTMLIRTITRHVFPTHDLQLLQFSLKNNGDLVLWMQTASSTVSHTPTLVLQIQTVNFQ